MGCILCGFRSTSIGDFCSVNGTDYLGRRLEDVWRWDNGKLEEVHIHFQVLFPNQEQSQLYWGALAYYFAESPYSNFCGTFRSVGLPSFAKVMIQVRSKALSCHF